MEYPQLSRKFVKKFLTNLNNDIKNHKITSNCPDLFTSEIYKNVNVLHTNYKVTNEKVEFIEELVSLAIKGKPNYELEGVLRKKYNWIGDYAEICIRTLVSFAYSQRKQIQAKPLEDRGVIVAYELSTSGDGRVRPEHRKMNGTIISVKNSQINRLMPPWDYNCRCVARPILKYEGQQRGWQYNENGKMIVQENFPSGYDPNVAKKGFGIKWSF